MSHPVEMGGTRFILGEKCAHFSALHSVNALYIFPTIGATETRTIIHRYKSTLLHSGPNYLHLKFYISLYW